MASSSWRVTSKIGSMIRGKVRPDGARVITGVSHSQDSGSKVNIAGVSRQEKWGELKSGGGIQKDCGSYGGRQEMAGGRNVNWRETFESIDPSISVGGRIWTDILPRSTTNVGVKDRAGQEHGGDGMWRESFQTVPEVKDPTSDAINQETSSMEDLEMTMSMLRMGSQAITSVAAAVSALQPMWSALLSFKNNCFKRNIAQFVKEENKVGYMVALVGVESEDHITVFVDHHNNHLYITGHRFKHSGIYPLKRDDSLPKGNFRNSTRTTTFNSNTGLYTIVFEGFNKEKAVESEIDKEEEAVESEIDKEEEAVESEMIDICV